MDADKTPLIAPGIRTFHSAPTGCQQVIHRIIHSGTRGAWGAVPAAESMRVRTAETGRVRYND